MCVGSIRPSYIKRTPLNLFRKGFENLSIFAKVITKYQESFFSCIYINFVSSIADMYNINHYDSYRIVSYRKKRNSPSGNSKQAN